MALGFEFNPDKSESNKIKHGIDFDEIQQLWLNSVVEVPAKIEGGETRYLVIGEIKGVPYSAVITYVKNARRIISARKANAKETRILNAFKN
jgi:uncharacterized protein